MKLLIIFLLSFNSFGQDTCACTRLDKRLRHDLDKYAIKLFDDQHKRENTKEIKSFRFQLRTFKAENKTIREQFKLSKDSLKRSNRLLLLQEKNRNSEKEKAQSVEIKHLKSEYKLQSKELDKQMNSNTLVWWVGIVLSLCLVLVIVWKIKH